MYKQKDDGIFISQDKYVADILKKFDFVIVKTASTPIETNKALLKDEEAEDVDVHLYRSMIRSLMYLTASRPDIMFAVCACARFQVTPKVLWIQNRMLDYGFNFMNIRIYIDNESTICIMKNPVFHSKTKHIEIRHHFIRDSYEKRLIQVIKIHTYHNVADLFTKAFDVSRIGTAMKKLSTDIGMSKEVGTPRYLSLVVPLKKVGNEAVHKELGDRMKRAATTASSLEAKQDIGSGPRCQDTILGDVDAQTRFEITSKQSNDPPLSRGYTLGSGEDSMKLFELMELCTQLSHKNKNECFGDPKRIERLSELKNRKRDVCIKTERELVRIKFDDENCFLDEIWVITGVLKLMLLSIPFLLLVYINVVKLMLGSVNAVRHMLMLPVQVPAAEESDGFAEIIDFLKASSVHYALTVNPVIYTSCIEQFWVTAKVQTVNGVRQLQALVNKKRVIITESSIRSDLHLDDAEGTDCLPTTTIFEDLARMGYEKPSQKLTFYKAFFSPQWKYFIHTITQCLSAKSTTWNEFSSTMASLIICLATNQKFNLSKYIFDAMAKHVDGGVKFLMYLRFLQVFINQQLGDISNHKKIFVNPSHTKKVFANMKRAGKDFSRRITPLFDTMIVQASKEVGEDSDHPIDSNQIPIVDQPSIFSQPKKKQKSKRTHRKEA
ncbi:hypothetical protein Tco_0514482 [Tanacetum coccineum]